MLFLRYLFITALLSLTWVAPVAAADESSEWSEKFAPFVYRQDDPSLLILAGEIDIRTSLNFSRFVLEHGVCLTSAPAGQI